MGRQDTAEKRFFEDNTNFADLVNGFIFRGKPVIRPDDLTERDSTEALTAIFGRNLLTEQRWRDVLKSVTVKDAAGKCVLMLIGLENESKINYAVVVKDLLYDALNYARQVQETAKRNRKEKAGFDDTGEFLTGFLRTDRLVPVITIVNFMRPGKWDGPTHLHEMFDPDFPKDLLALVPDYRVNILVPEDTDPNLFKTDFRQIVKVARAGTTKEELEALIKNDPAFQTVDKDAAAVIWAMAGKKVRFPSKKERKEKVDMLKGFQEWTADVDSAKAEAAKAKKEKARAEARADKAEAKAREADRARAEAEARADKAEARADKAEARADKAEARADKAEAAIDRMQRTQA